LVLLIALLAFVVTTAFEHKAEIVIDKPKAAVFEYVRSIKNQDEWNVWAKEDPNMKQELIGTDGTVGFVETWEGNSKAGKGSQEIKKITEGERVDIEFRFEKPFKLTNDVYFTTATVEGNKTKVVWSISGNSPRPFNLLFPIMKGSMMKGLNEGLKNLKVLLEK
jgi:hypothetical protein